MGQGQSALYVGLDRVMPPVNKHGSDCPLTGWLDKSSKPFSSDKDKEQFIYATITVLTQNGMLSLKLHNFRLLYSRRESGRIVARIVAEKDGIINAQIEPPEAGKDQVEAFLALRKHVEIQLDHILRDVPGSSSVLLAYDKKPIAGPSKANMVSGVSPSSPGAVRLETPNPSAGSNEAIDAPPAYGRAVKDWKADEKR